MPCSPKHAGTSNDLLEELYESTECPAIPPLVELKKLEKTSSTYLDGGKGGFKQHIRPDGRIHANWGAGEAETGRFVCSDPNMMNPPKGVKIHDEQFDIQSDNAIREMLSAMPGTVMMNADWSQLEVWILAYVTGDETLLGLLQSGEDVHTFVARELCKMGLSAQFQSESASDESVSNIEWRAKHESLRGDAKTFTFGISYGLTAEGAADRLHCSVEAAQALIDGFLVIFPSLREYMRRIHEEVLQTGAVRNPFGRVRHFPEVAILQALGYTYDLEAVFREAINFPIQSGGHDLHALAHIATEADEALITRAWPVMEMHDSLAMEADIVHQIQQTAWMVKSLWESVAKNTIMPNGKPLGWEIPVEATWGPNFGDERYKINARGADMRVNDNGNWEPY